MFAYQLISDSIPALRTTDTIQKVHERMSEFRINHLPIVNEKQFLGLVSDEDLIQVLDSNAQVGSLFLSLHNPFVFEDQHVYDVIRIFYEQKLSAVPVIDVHKNYKGLISINTMMEHMATITSVSEPGGIIILEIINRNNSLAHISQIVESDNAQILSSYVKSFQDSTKLEITLKLNRTDLSSILASFLRYDYHIKATFNDIKSDDGTSDRYDQLMNYLNI